MENEAINVGKFIKERIMENKEMFNKEEIKLICKNEKCIKKIYLLGFINARCCYKYSKNNNKI